jgi:hypothetical protein
MKASLEKRIPKEVHALQSQLHKDEGYLVHKVLKKIPMSFGALKLRENTVASYAKIDEILGNSGEKIPSFFPSGYVEQVQNSVHNNKEALIKDVKNSLPRLDAADLYKQLVRLRSEVEEKNYETLTPEGKERFISNEESKSLISDYKRKSLEYQRHQQASQIIEHFSGEKSDPGLNAVIENGKQKIEQLARYEPFIKRAMDEVGKSIGTL